MKKRFQRHFGSSDDYWSRYLRTLGVGPYPHPNPEDTMTSFFHGI